MIVSQPGNRGIDSILNRLAFRGLLRGWGFIHNVGGNRPLVRINFLIQGIGWMPANPFQFIQAGIGGHPVDPGRKLGIAFEFIEIFKNLDHDFLRHVSSVVGIPCDTVRYGENAFLMLGDQLLERGNVAGLSLLLYTFITFGSRSFSEASHEY